MRPFSTGRNRAPPAVRFNFRRSASGALSGIALLFLFACRIATAGEADVIAAKVRPGAVPGQFSFDVTIRSRDRGWDYYAERFEIFAPDGTIFGARILLHPHEDEQPFTRELHDVPIPADTRMVAIRAWMKRGTQMRAAGGDVFRLTLPGR